MDQDAQDGEAIPIKDIKQDPNDLSKYNLDNYDDDEEAPCVYSPLKFFIIYL
jgi:hypothetical protein